MYVLTYMYTLFYYIYIYIYIHLKNSERVLVCYVSFGFFLKKFVSPPRDGLLFNIFFL